jgi:hypothetical protein
MRSRGSSSGGRAGWLVALALLFAGRAARAQPAQEGLSGAAAARAGNRADYHITARLDGEKKQLAGKVELRWTNGSGEAVSDLWFHLYLNAFSNNRSTHLQESGGKLRDKELAEDWGWSRVTALFVAGVEEGGSQDVMPTFRYRRPDDRNEEDRTVFSVDLPRPVASGDSVRVEITWECQLPRVRRRTGYKDDFLLVAQWFPKLGVYEAGRGWNCHQFHQNTEFYSDYGSYDVTLDLPIEYENKVFGSGASTFHKVEGDRVKVRFVAPSEADQRRLDGFGKRPLVHDFTWTADPDFVVYRQTFRYKEWAERFPGAIEEMRAVVASEEELKLRDVDVTVLIQPERASQAERHFQATCAALFFYGLWFGEYPYEHVTVVDPAWGASGAGGMEYPTLFTCGTRLFAREKMQQPESVTVHECGHQFWYGLVGNNEFEAAWLDEGFNSYTDAEVLWRVYGRDRSTTDYGRVPVDGVRVAGLPGGGKIADALAVREVQLPLPLLPDPKLPLLRESGALDYWRDQPLFVFAPQWTDPRWNDRVSYLRDPDTDPIQTHGWLYADQQSYGTNSYARTGAVLRTLRGLIGDQAFHRGMRHYARAWRYAHPYPEDFYAAFEQGSGLELDWYFRELFQGTGTGDWSVAVEQEERRPPRGFFQGEGGQFLQREEQAPAAGATPDWHVEIELRRKGELCLPMTVLLTFADGSTQRLEWTREEQTAATWKRIEFDSKIKLASAVIDPERRIYIDRDLSNNRWYDQTDAVSPWRWSERVFAQYQRYLHWIQGLGG